MKSESKKDAQQSNSVPSDPQSGEQMTFASDAILERFAKSFEASARRWELIVYPSLFAFIILAGYGFFLVYSLTKDMHTLAGNVDPQMARNMEIMANNVAVLSEKVGAMSGHVETMTGTLTEMLVKFERLDKSVEAMQVDLATMSGNVTTMTVSMQEAAFKLNALEPIRLEMNAMNANVSRMGYDVNKFTRPQSFLPFFQ